MNKIEMVLYRVLLVKQHFRFMVKFQGLFTNCKKNLIWKLKKIKKIKKIF